MARAPLRLLIAILIGGLALDVTLLAPFLGMGPGITLLASAAAITLTIAAVRMTPAAPGPGVAAWAGCIALAAAIYLLGGEGRFFYANVDWMVRDAVLRDMAIHPWPFAYTARGVPEMLRAPIGMYLLPALAMKGGGQIAGDLALLAQNSVLLGTLLALAAPLFANRRARLVALVVIVAFSGMDVIGAMLVDGIPGFLARDHLEWWTVLQFSSHLTQAFWTPQHALAGWIGAVAFLLWRDRRLRLGLFLALVPLSILWSPLGAMGVLPFAALATVQAVRDRTIRPGDVLLPLAASFFVLPVLLYLSAAGESVGVRWNVERWQSLLVLHLLETVPFAWFALRRPPWRFGLATPLVAFATLLMVSAVRIGWSSDVTMRASIPALAILAVIVADRLLRSHGGERIAIVAVLAIGAVTGLAEVRRALNLPPAPAPRCSFIRAFDYWGPNPNAAKSNYLAPIASLPRWIRPQHVMPITARDPAQCLAGPWPRPTGVF